MDLHDLWQEHKRFLLGALAGFVAFWIGWIVIGSVYSPDTVLKKARTDAQAVSGELFDQQALVTLRDENARLLAAEESLRKALAWQPRDDFVLEGKGPADLHFDTLNRRLRQRLRGLLEEQGVELPEKTLEWTVPTEREEIQGLLYAFDLIDHTAQRLLAAHRRVRETNPEAQGLAAIEKVRIERTKAAATYRGGGRAKVRIEDVVQEERIELQLRCDSHVLRLFLEACRAEQPPIGLADLKVQQSRLPGDPLLVTCKLAAFVFRKQEG